MTWTLIKLWNTLIIESDEKKKKNNHLEIVVYLAINFLTQILEIAEQKSNSKSVTDEGAWHETTTRVIATTTSTAQPARRAQRPASARRSSGRSSRGSLQYRTGTDCPARQLCKETAPAVEVDSMALATSAVVVAAGFVRNRRDSKCTWPAYRTPHRALLLLSVRPPWKPSPAPQQASTWCAVAASSGCLVAFSDNVVMLFVFFLVVTERESCDVYIRELG